VLMWRRAQRPNRFRPLGFALRGRSSVGRALASQATPRIPTLDDDRPLAPINAGVAVSPTGDTPHRSTGRIRREWALKGRQAGGGELMPRRAEPGSAGPSTRPPSLWQVAPKSQARTRRRRAAMPTSIRAPGSTRRSSTGATSQQRVICGKASCRDRRFKRLHPEAYAERERQKVERRRERRKAAKAGAE
jgi:hypothetical protein